jgi:hypothetical protein
MRKLCLTGVLIVLLAMPVLAQFGMFGGGGGFDAVALLGGSEDVQKALKLTDEQKGAIKEATAARQKAFEQAKEDMDFEGFRKGQEAFAKAITKVKDSLKPEQLKRLNELEVQAAIQMNQPSIFKQAHIQKALKLSDKQKELVKETLTDLDKDLKELREDAKGDFSKFKEMMTKTQSMNKEAFSKIAKTFNDDQKTAWKELQGEKFDGKFFSFGKFGKKKKKDDF